MSPAEISANTSRYGCLLLADAHHEILKGTRSLLGSIFSTVIMVTEQESLIQAVKLMTPELVVVDISLPGQVKGNVVKRIVDEAPNVPIVALGMDNDRNVIEQILDSGAQAVVVKPSVGTDLIPAIEQALEGKTYMSPSVGVTPLDKKSK